MSEMPDCCEPKKVGRLTVRVRADEFPPNPREDYNLGEILYLGRNLVLGDRRVEREEIAEYVEPDGRHHKALGKIVDGRLWLPVYCYNHSIVRVSTHSFLGRAQHAEWDSGLCGVIVATRARAKKLGVRWRTEEVTEQLTGEIEDFDRWTAGEYVCWSVEDGVGDTLDSCAGYTDVAEAMAQGVAHAEDVLRGDSLAGIPEREAALVRSACHALDALAARNEPDGDEAEIRQALDALSALLLGKYGLRSRRVTDEEWAAHNETLTETNK